MFRQVYLSFFVSILAGNAVAQSTANIKASATIVKSVGVTGGRDIENLHGVSLQPPKKFDFTGLFFKSLASINIISENETYDVSLPQDAVTLTRVNGKETMEAGRFTSKLQPAKTGGGVVSTISIDAVLNLASSQTPGRYISSQPFTATIHFN